MGAEQEPGVNSGAELQENQAFVTEEIYWQGAFPNLGNVKGFACPSHKSGGLGHPAPLTQCNAAPGETDKTGGGAVFKILHGHSEQACGALSECKKPLYGGGLWRT